MCRLTRAEVFNPNEVAIIHTMCRVVRRCFLFGFDPVTLTNYDHRKVWIEEKMRQQAAYFGIELITFAIISNHIHQVLKSRPDVVQTWDDTEVARRWMMLCPKRKDEQGNPKEPTEKELDSIRTKPKKLAETRTRLSDISWWMRLMCQYIGKRANREEKELGRFFQGRFKAVRLEDEEAVLACSVYVDLNPIRAAMAQTIEVSDYTSGKLRAAMIASPTDEQAKESFLAPIELQESAPPETQTRSRSKKRCSDKGVMKLTELDYLELLDLTARIQKANKVGFTDADLPPILVHLGISLDHWANLTMSFGKLFSSIAGNARTISDSRTLVTKRPFYQKRFAS